MIRKDEKVVRKPKSKRAQETQNARGHAQITRKLIAKTKWVCPNQNNKKKANQRKTIKEKD
jgi:hypothetical protein